jgi:hypothetical protein
MPENDAATLESPSSKLPNVSYSIIEDHDKKRIILQVNTQGVSLVVFFSPDLGEQVANSMISAAGKVRTGLITPGQAGKMPPIKEV